VSTNATSKLRESEGTA
jgi:serine/threonine protein kinase